MEARVIFSKKTKDMLGKELSAVEKGKLRYEKLKEIADSGRLSVAKNRNDVANLIGILSEPYGTGYNWVTGLIRKGYLKETIIQIGAGGNPEYEYTLTNKQPQYDPTQKRKAPQKSKKKETLRERGKVLYTKLKALEESGELALAKNRNNVAKMTGATRTWVCGMIERGFLNEKLEDYVNGLPVYKYRLTGKEPNYDYVKKNRNFSPQNQTKGQYEEPTQTVGATKNYVDAIKNNYTVEFSRGDISAKLEASSQEEIIRIIKEVLNGGE